MKNIKAILLSGITASLMAIAAPEALAYEVQPGDTLTKIAVAHNTTLGALSHMNPRITNLNNIYVGQKIDVGDAITASEFDLLARLVTAEADSEPYEGKMAVVEVVLNRLESPEFPNTITEIIYQEGQFEPVMNGWIDKDASRASILATRDALDYPGSILKDKDVLYFWDPLLSTNFWQETLTPVMTIGTHTFSKEA